MPPILGFKDLGSLKWECGNCPLSQRPDAEGGGESKPHTASKNPTGYGKLLRRLEEGTAITVSSSCLKTLLSLI